MRPVTALFCLGLRVLGLCVPLAGCLTPGPTGDATPELTAAPAPAPPAPAMPAGRAATAPKPSATAAAAAASSGSSGKKEDWTEGGVTREKINSMCWMKYESGRRDLPVEKRADLVNQCVIDTMKEYPLN